MSAQEAIAGPRLHVGHGFHLPLETAVVQRYGFVGTVGSGKSSTAQVLAEEFLAHQVQIVVIDPTGTWWGLRAKREDASKPSGLLISVIGGKNGDMPLDLERGAEYARWVVEKLPSVIFDLKGARPGKREQFVEAFMRELYRLKGEARERTPLHVFLEEAQRWAAQQPGGREEKAVSYLMREIAEMIRNDGVGLSYITQAPQAVDKRQLNLTECLFIHQVNGKHERIAVKDWAIDKGEDLGDVDLVSLEIGHAIVWSPRWLKMREKVHIRLKRTFYAGSTLKFGEKSTNVAPPLPEKALEDLRSALAEASKTAAANDPKQLQRENAQLRAELARKVTAPAAVRVERVTEYIVAPDTLAQLAALAAEARERARLAQEAEAHLWTAVDGLTKQIKLGIQKTAAEPLARRVGAAVSPAASAHVVPDAAPNRGPERASRPLGEPVKLGGGETRVLAALSTVSKPMPRQGLAIRTVFAEGGGFRNVLSSLRTAGLLEDGAGGFSITEAGRAALKVMDGRKTPLDAGEILEAWRRKITGGARRILDALVAAYPDALSRQELADKADFVEGGGYRNCLSELRVPGLLVEASGAFEVNKILLEG